MVQPYVYVDLGECRSIPLQMHSDGPDVFGGAQLSMHLKSAGSAGMSVRCHHHGLMSFLPALVASWIVSLHIFARTHCQNVFVGFLNTDATAH